MVPGAQIAAGEVNTNVGNGLIVAVTACVTAQPVAAIVPFI